MIPPSIVRLRIRETGKSGFGLWLPLFLLWPIALVLALMLAPFVLIALIVLTLLGGGLRHWQMPVEVYRMICALRGLCVEVEQPGQEIKIVVT